MAKVAFIPLIQFGWSPYSPITMLSAIVSSPCLEPLNSPTQHSSCVCLHACCVCYSVISHTDSPLVAGEWFHIPLGNLCRTNSLQEWKGWEGGTTREQRRNAGKEEICGEIIIPGVTVATFCEADVNKILSYTIYFNFASKRCCKGVRRQQQEGGNTCTHTQTHFCRTPRSEVAGDVCCLQTDWEAQRCL